MEKRWQSSSNRSLDLGQRKREEPFLEEPIKCVAQIDNVKAPELCKYPPSTSVLKQEYLIIILVIAMPIVLFFKSLIAS